MRSNLHDDLIRFKEELIGSGLFKHMNTVQYTCQCPYCYDNKQHCYVKIDTASDIPVLYWCHKCTAHGIIKQDFLDRLNLDIKLPKYFGHTNFSDENKGVTIKVIGETVNEKHYTERVRTYIEDRVGHYPTIEELQMFNYVGDPRKYAFDYLGYNGEGRPFNNRFWFKLTNANITGRWKDDNTEHRWFRFKTDRIKSAGLYTLRKGIDPTKQLTVVIAEGIFDIIGLYYNMELENGIYIACMGKGYERGLRHVLNKGIFGDSVDVRIYRDPDVKDEDVTISKWLAAMFNSVELYHNAFDKDYGVKPEFLDIHKSLNWKGANYEPDKKFSRKV